MNNSGAKNLVTPALLEKVYLKLKQIYNYIILYT